MLQASVLVTANRQKLVPFLCFDIIIRPKYYSKELLMNFLNKFLCFKQKMCIAGKTETDILNAGYPQETIELAKTLR